MEIKEYTLRKATTTDHDLIYGLKKESIYAYVEEIWGWDEDYQVKDFNKDFQNIEQFQVIESDGCFIGFVQLYIHDKYVELVEIHLVSEKRGNGIGSTIIKSIINDAINTGRTVRLGCFKKNFDANSLYVHIGFKQVSETDTHYILEYNPKYLH